MEQQQVIEEVVSGNKLIMEFLELDKCTDEEHRDNPCYWHEADGEYLTASQTKYHSSWDWLKPVVDEIFTYSLAHPEQVEKIRNMSIVVEIKPCWEKCVEFIKWLNNHNSQTK